MPIKLVRVILLGLFFTITKVASTKIFPSEGFNDFIIGKDASPPALKSVATETLEDEVSWKSLLGGVMPQLILFLIVSS